MLGDHAQHGGRASADQDRRVGALDGLGVAERPGELDVGALEVERFGLGPQPPDHGARFGEAPHGVGEVVVGQAVRFILAPGPRDGGPRACADTEVEPSAGDDVDGRGDLGQHRGRPEAVAGHEQAEAQSLGLRGEGREQCPAFEDRSVRVAADRHEVIEQPRMLDLAGSCPPRARLAGRRGSSTCCGGGRDPETRPECLRHGSVRPFQCVLGHGDPLRGRSRWGRVSATSLRRIKLLQR